MSDTPAGHSPLGSDPLQAAQDLTGALTAMTEQLAQVKTTVRRGRRIIIALVISLLLDVALTAGVTVAAVDAGNASAKANATVAQLHTTQVGACRAGNQTREAEIGLWEHLFMVSVAARTPTRAERAADERLLAFIHQTFAPKNCAAIYRLQPDAAARDGK